MFLFKKLALFLSVQYDEIAPCQSNFGLCILNELGQSGHDQLRLLYHAYSKKSPLFSAAQYDVTNGEEDESLNLDTSLE